MLRTNRRADVHSRPIRRREFFGRCKLVKAETRDEMVALRGNSAYEHLRACRGVSLRVGRSVIFTSIRAIKRASGGRRAGERVREEKKERETGCRMGA